MRLTVVTYNIKGGGAPLASIIWANAWSRQGHDVTLISLFPEHGIGDGWAVDDSVNQVVADMTEHPVSNKLMAGVQLARNVLRLRKAISASRPGIIVSFEGPINIRTLLASFGMRTPVVIMEQTHPGQYEIGRFWDKVRNFIYPRARVQVNLTHAAMDWCRDRYAIRHGAVIPNPLENPDVGSTMKRTKVIVAAGRFVPQKRFDLLVDAFYLLAEKYPDWTLVIHGDGPDRKDIEEQIQQYSLQDRIQLPGWSGHLAAEMARGEFFVLSSEYEGFGNVICEAMAVGLPVVAFDCPSGPAEIIRDGVDGLLVEPLNVEALSETMAKVIEDEQLRIDMRKKTSEVFERFSVESTLDKWDDVFSLCWEGKGGVLEKETPLDERFAFGKNWSDFLKKLTPERIREAEESLTHHLGDVSGKSFLDIGCGSGLFSLAAKNLGANVASFDFDPDSVACAKYLKDTYHPDSDSWSVSQGSALDEQMMAGLDRYDVVYSWGVLHHTGNLWQAMSNAIQRVDDGGLFFISIYNDQGGYSDMWKAVKRAYVKSPDWVRTAMCLGVLTFMEARFLTIQLVRLRNPIKMYKARNQGRGMNLWNDLKDWVGGYPFEVAKPEEIFDFCRERGFELTHLKTSGGGIACNEYVFVRKPSGSTSEG